MEGAAILVNATSLGLNGGPGPEAPFELAPPEAVVIEPVVYGTGSGCTTGVAEQIGGQHGMQRTAGLALADGRADRSDDDGVTSCVTGHCVLLNSSLSTAFYTQL